MAEVSAPRIFLAHAQEDEAAVIQLYNRLKQAGYNPWLDKKDLLPGQNWRNVIPKVIKSSALFIACFSKTSVEKHGYIQREFRQALMELAQKPADALYLIPLRLDDCEIPDLRQDEYGINLKDFQWLDYFEPDSFDRLMQTIQAAGIEAGQAHQTPPATTAESPQPNSPPQPPIANQPERQQGHMSLVPQIDQLPGSDGVLQHGDVEQLVALLAKTAMFSLDGPQAFFRSLVLEADWPDAFRMQVLGSLSGAPDAIARNLIFFAKERKINPSDPKFSTLGSLLKPLFPKVGFEVATTLAALIVRYRLYRDPKLLGKLIARYQVPLPAGAAADTGDVSTGPDFDWRGPNEAVQLQGLFQRHRSLSWDLTFLKRGIEQAASVCRIEQADGTVLGTGFLIAEEYVLTNYHVLVQGANTTDLVFRFRCVTAEEGQEASGQQFKLADGNPIVDSSPVEEFDYALLRLEPSVSSVQGIAPVSVNWEHPPEKDKGVYLLQHPLGQTMQLALSPNGITGVYERKGLLQYISETAVGSSGSPCFNEDWQVVAIHHAQKSGAFGVYCEGILMSRIKERIQKGLQRGW